MKIKPEIAGYIELLVKFVDGISFLGNAELEIAMIPYRRAAAEVEAYLATYQDEKVI